jgi:hypothetical protein
VFFVGVATAGCSSPVGGGPAGGVNGSSGSGGSAGGITTGGGGATGGGGTTGGGSNGMGGASGSGGSAGTAGTQGNAGSGGSAPHTVKACPSDIGAVGVWEAVNPPDLPIPPADCGGQPCYFGTKAPVINPLDTSIVYLGTDGHGVFKSTDCAATWTKINTGKNADVMDSGASWSMKIDPVTPDTLYANNGYGSENGIFKSTNGGVDWEQTMPAGSVVANNVQYKFASIMSMDPADPAHLVVSFHSNCLNEYAPNCLAETTDGAATWKLIKMPVGGGEAAGVAMVNTQTWTFGVPFNALWRTTDQGASWDQMADDGGYNLYRASTGTLFLAGGASNIFHSTDEGVTWDGTPAGGFYGLGGDGETMYASPRYCDTKCYWTSPETDGVTWTSITTEVSGHGAVDITYDPDHHILYSSNETGGFWRVVTH